MSKLQNRTRGDHSGLATWPRFSGWPTCSVPPALCCKVRESIATRESAASNCETETIADSRAPPALNALSRLWCEGLDGVTLRVYAVKLPRQRRARSRRPQQRCCPTSIVLVSASAPWLAAWALYDSKNFDRPTSKSWASSTTQRRYTPSKQLAGW